MHYNVARTARATIAAQAGVHANPAATATTSALAACATICASRASGNG
jgi:hypothetical protein